MDARIHRGPPGQVPSKHIVDLVWLRPSSERAEANRTTLSRYSAEGHRRKPLWLFKLHLWLGAEKRHVGTLKVVSRKYFAGRDLRKGG